MQINDTSIEELCLSVVKQACDDYSRAYMGETIDHKHADYTIHECELFFKRGIKLYTNIDGEWLKARTKLHAIDKAIDIYSRYLEVAKSSISITIHSDAKNGIERESYIIQPKLEDDFKGLIRKQLKALKKERAEIMKEIGE